MPTLLIRTPDGRERTVALLKPLTRVGHSSDNEVVLEDPRAGDTALVLALVNGRHEVTGLGGPVLVNDRKRDTHVLAEGDVLRVGDSLLTYSTRAAAPSPAPAAPRPSVPSRSMAGGAVPDPDGHTAELPGVVGREQALLESLAKLSRHMLESYAIDPLLTLLLDEAIQVTRADKGFLVLVHGEKPEVRAARNVARETLQDAAGRMSDSIVQKVLETHQPLVVADALGDPSFGSSQSVVNLKLLSVMCVPLTQRGQLIGLLYLGNDRLVNRFERKSLDMLTIFAAQASLLLQNALLVNELQGDNARLRGEIEAGQFGQIIGAGEGMQAVFRRVEKIAQTDISVLITGETGTGKELVAREIHRRSPRKAGPFITINCGAIPGELLESELFGHVRGAFTGAVATRQGKFQQAHGGTLFLDEIGEMPLQLQVKLLRVLQEKVVHKVGAADARGEAVDIRVLAATNRVLEDEVKAGRFREDLYYRLNVVTLRLPPLRERVSDVALLGRYFLDKYSREFNSRAREFSQPALVALGRYAWPGNVRELENRIKKAVVLADRPYLTPEDLDLRAEQLEPIKPLALAKEEWQRGYINGALARNGGNATKTAKDLQVDPRTIFRHKAAERARNGEPAIDEEELESEP
jgi:transcriptional regulator with GAF, ATPase, and Fis domain